MKRVPAWQARLPEDLRADKYNYPDPLFRDRDHILRFDGSDDIYITIPLSSNEKVILMAKYAVAKALRLLTAEARLIRLVRDEEGDAPTFMQAMRKVRRSETMGDLGKGDIELQAEELGVYEIIWPFDPEKMREAVEAEQRGEEIKEVLIA